MTTKLSTARPVGGKLLPGAVIYSNQHYLIMNVAARLSGQLQKGAQKSFYRLYLAEGGKWLKLVHAPEPDGVSTRTISGRSRAMSVAGATANNIALLQGEFVAISVKPGELILRLREAKLRSVETALFCYARTGHWPTSLAPNDYGRHLIRRLLVQQGYPTDGLRMAGETSLMLRTATGALVDCTTDTVLSPEWCLVHPMFYAIGYWERRPKASPARIATELERHWATHRIKAEAANPFRKYDRATVEAQIAKLEPFRLPDLPVGLKWQLVYPGRSGYPGAAVRPNYVSLSTVMLQQLMERYGAVDRATVTVLEPGRLKLVIGPDEERKLVTLFPVRSRRPNGRINYFRLGEQTPPGRYITTTQTGATLVLEHQEGPDE